MLALSLPTTMPLCANSPVCPSDTPLDLEESGLASLQLACIGVECRRDYHITLFTDVTFSPHGVIAVCPSCTYLRLTVKYTSLMPCVSS